MISAAKRAKVHLLIFVKELANRGHPSGPLGRQCLQALFPLLRLFFGDRAASEIQIRKPRDQLPRVSTGLGSGNCGYLCNRSRGWTALRRSELPQRAAAPG